ncbi:DUF2510 domain-containing protein, partial [Streptomyces sp. JJ38]|uniref:DUF2510 domain-containing protein n=1 Tax=Streptomyces sp. JJ38 TaxID=2738128 RepID=UPI001C58DEF3
MSAPPSASANGSTPAGYYPDPSIPGYIRYWDGVAWVPGTSRPEPRPGEPLPEPPAGVRPPAVPEPRAATPEPRAATPAAEPRDAVPTPSRNAAPAPAPAPVPAAEPRDAAPVPRGSVPAEETGPVFLDDQPGPSDARPEGRQVTPRQAAAEPDGQARPEPAAAWRADASRQSGFGADADRRVSWGAGGGAGA